MFASCRKVLGCRRLVVLALGVMFAWAGFVPHAQAIQPADPGQGPSGVLASGASPLMNAAELEVAPSFEAPQGLQAMAAGHPGIAHFLQRHPGSWTVTWDRRNDRPNLIQGSGIALVPGSGNRLTMASLGLAPGATVDLATVETLLRDFITANEAFLQVRGLELRLDPEASIPYGDGSTHWFIELEQYAGGVRVDGAQLFFRLSHGNIVQFGAEKVAPVLIDTRPSIDRQAAFRSVWTELGFAPEVQITETLEPGELILLPAALAGEQPGQPYTGMAGAGYEHRLAWRFVFRVSGSDATWEVRFDAHRGQIIGLRNLTVNAQATVTGGIYPTTNTDPEIVVPMPFLAVSNGGAKVTDALGMYDYTGGTASTALDGKYFKMSDGCGGISLSNAIDGNLAFGISGGTDCTTPGVGGVGNTHASRTGFYHLTNINRKAATFHPGNSWLASKVTANMNINDQCNASWDGTSMNFFKSGGGCSNTGELAAVFLHEWGHGMDTNTGGAASENGSGEAVGDTFAFLETRDACIGKNFRPGVPCYNCDASCTGVRDVAAFSTLGAAVVARPSTVTHDGGINCDRFACPYYQSGIWPYMGPMGYEGHCESYIAGSANWDLAQSLVGAWGTEQGYAQMDKIWYGSLVPSKSAYRVASGGQCNASASVDGCGSNNWYTVFLAADDDDGNLANGTPNACRIWDAFNAHGIACGARPACSPVAAGFLLEITPASGAVCAPGNTSYTVATLATGLPPLSNPITLSASGLPAGVTASFAPNPVTPGSSSTLTVNVGGAAAAGNYAITVNGQASGADNQSAGTSLTVSNGVPPAPALATPANGAVGVAPVAALAWNASSGASSYAVEVASDAGFSNVVASQSGIVGTSATFNLGTSTTYYWRARAESLCGTSPASAAWSFTTAAAPFPHPYCSVSFPSAVEPITRVVFAGIDNTSPAAVNGSPALEDFTAISGNVMPGATLPISVEGNTAGDFTTKIRAYIDWNQDGDFTDAGESYDLTDLRNSTGTDGKQSTGSIAVPAGAAPGTTRMRVLKKYSSFGNPCNSSGYGQAEDYTLVVGSGTTHVVTAASTGNGSITPPTQTVNHGGTANFSVTPASGYHVASVTGDTCTVTGSGANWSAANIQADCAVTATFAQTSYTVTASSAGNGTITPPTQTVNHGGTANFSVTPA
ncbi:GEVED domain-containing protein, partial [Dokdonella sp.]|uniref:GEVED domain-containing protein n=1 Tax=Dokdonella sp. TaxID=2291710 RepID=UPI0031CC2BCB|nr:GEVED domain-containing protein [Dokdonella sp.]